METRFFFNVTTVLLDKQFVFLFVCFNFIYLTTQVEGGGEGKGGLSSEQGADMGLNPRSQRQMPT